MTKLLAAAALAALLPALSACCSKSDIRYWQLRDAATGATIYGVDTAEAQVGRVPGERYVDGQGRYVDVRGGLEIVRELSAAEWDAQTRGTDTGVRWCPVLKACWARPYAE
jgi:hypothetical protein